MMNRKKFFTICLVLILLIGGIVTYKFWPCNQGLYKVTVLSIYKGNFIVSNAINDSGQIAGFTEVSQGVYNAFLWDHEKELQEFGPVINMGIYLNNAGQVAGSLWDMIGNSRAFIRDPNTKINILPTLGGRTAFAYGINDLGQVVGSADTSTGVPHAFLWDAQLGIMDLTPESKSRTVAISINNANQVVVIDQNDTLVVKVKDNKIIESSVIPLQGLCYINNNGYVVGPVLAPEPNYLDICIWHPDSGIKKIFKTKNSPSYSINDLNQVIITDEPKYYERSTSSIQTSHYLSDPNLGLISLDGIVSYNKHKSLFFSDINNKGLIIGDIQSRKSANTRALLFEPVLEEIEKLIKSSNARE